jgi:topoisomerase-4 subunit A
LLTLELKIRLKELEEDWHYSSLEKIFFEQRIYRELEKDTETWEMVIDAIDKGFNPFRKLLRREITRDDLLKLTESPFVKSPSSTSKRPMSIFWPLERDGGG